MLEVVTDQRIQANLLFWEDEALPCHPVEEAVETFCISLPCTWLNSQPFERT